MEIIWIATAFAFGFIFKINKLPALIGYLLAGFFITIVSPYLGVEKGSQDILGHISHVGILLLLFTVGLKIKVSQVAKKEIVGTGIAHMGVSVLIFTPVIMYLFSEPLHVALVLAGLFSFSSTVLAVKVLDNKKELKAFHGRIAIGVLIVQDLLAMIMLSITSGHIPSAWALLVALIVFLPVTKRLLYALLDKSGHDEMLIVCGMLFAVVIGAGSFHSVGLSGELGALVIGVLCAKHSKATELSDALWSVKELFLVAFFLTIGLNGLPTLEDIYFAVVMVALLPLQAIAFFALLTIFKLKSRSAFLASMSLTNFSEFGLIVAAVAAPNWLVPIAIAVALSFMLSAPLNHFSHQIFDRLESFLSQFERHTEHPDTEPLSLGDASLLVMGMGQIGRSAYKAATGKGMSVIGLDSDPDKIKKLTLNSYNVLYADAEHADFWKKLDLTKLSSVILAMDCEEATVSSVKELRKAGFSGKIVAHSRYHDVAKLVEDAGADLSYVTNDEAGKGLVASL